jgi:hypothetical protein
LVTRALCPTAPAGPNTWRAAARPTDPSGGAGTEPLSTGSRGDPVGARNNLTRGSRHMSVCAAPGRAFVRGCRGGRSASLLLGWWPCYSFPVYRKGAVVPGRRFGGARSPEDNEIKFNYAKRLASKDAMEVWVQYETTDFFIPNKALNCTASVL